MSSARFTEEDFGVWNVTTSVVSLPAKIVGKDKATVIRNDFISAIGANNIVGCQILPRMQLRVQFKTGQLRRSFDIRGVDFRGVHLTTEAAYETITQVFVEAAPFQFPNELFREPLASYGRITQVKHLPVKGFPHIQSGTRMVSMCLKRPIPAFVTIAGFRCKVWYHGQPISCFACGHTGHMQSACPMRGKNGGPSFASVVSQQHVEGSRSQTVESPAVKKPQHFMTSPSLNEVLEAARLNTKEAGWTKVLSKKEKKKLGKQTEGNNTSGKAATKTSKPVSKTSKLAEDVLDASRKGPSKEWPERSVLPGKDGLLSIVTSTDGISASSLGTAISAGTPTSSESEPSEVLSRDVSVEGDILKVSISLQSAMNIPLPSEKKDGNLEEMAPKGQKRLRTRDRDSGSEDENASKKVFISPSAKPQEVTSSSQVTEDPNDLLDTTVTVHINPDAVSPTAGATVTEGASATTDSAPKEASIALLETVMSSPHIEEFSSTPTIGEFSSSEDKDESSGGPVSPSDGPSNASPSVSKTVTKGASVAAVAELALKEASLATLESASPEFPLSSTIGEFSSTEEKEGIIGGPVFPSAEPISDSIEYFSTPSGVHAVAQQPSALLDPAIVDVIPPTPENALPAVRSVSAIIGDVWSGGSFDSPISIWSGESLHDIAGHEVWEEDGCSSHPPSDDDLSDEGTLPSTPVLILSDIDNDSAENTAISSKGKHRPSQEEVVALMNLQPSDVPGALTTD